MHSRRDFLRLTGGLMVGVSALNSCKTTDKKRGDIVLAGVKQRPEAIRGLCLNAPKPDKLNTVLRLIEEVLPGLGCNTLVLLVRYQYEFQSHPQVREAESLSEADVHRLVQACRRVGIRLIPKMNLFGHQSSKKRGTERALLRAFPEFDETPELDEVGYCRCLCPRHPKVMGVVQDLTKELAGVFEADAFHVGLDEVFEVGKCPRCREDNPGKLFGDWVLQLHDHITGRLGLEMWLWGDRLLNPLDMPYNDHEVSRNQTWECVDQLPKDLVICDWHYDRTKTFPSTIYFLEKGFRMLSCPWTDEVVARDFIASSREAASQNLSGKGQWKGFLQTTWCDSALLAELLLGMKKDMKFSGVFEKDIPLYVSRVIKKGMPVGYEGDFLL